MKDLVIIICIVFLTIPSVLAQKKEAKKTPVTNRKEQPTSRKINVEYTTASGLKYKIIQEGNGAKAASGNTVRVHYTGTLTNGTKFDSSRDRNDPIKFKLGVGQVIKGWDEGIALLRVGDRAIFTIPPQLGYGDVSMGDRIPAGSTLIFDVELVEVIEPVKPWVLEKHDTMVTSSGLKYIVVSKTPNAEAPQAQAGKNVKVHYTGFLLNGDPNKPTSYNVFDSSVERGIPINFELGTGKVIKGWDEGIALMKEGDRLRLVIPPDLGYGAHGFSGVIPPNATLIFDVELISAQ